jgi:2-amino-4-hydroxy-6-hydroxymethyldihydropteridine diphosphokinase
MAEDVFIAIGSNINPQDNISNAVAALKTYVTIAAVSNFYKTPAAGRSQQPDFLNGVIKIQTDLKPRRLKFDILRPIENQLGRVRCPDRNASRTIDLDMILYDLLVINAPDFRIPDPAVRLYSFVAVPLLELAGQLILPDTHTPLANEPAAKSASGLHPEPEFTDRLRRLACPAKS